MNIVIYARFSSHNQNEQSIEGQLECCYDYAKKNGYTVIKEYIDRAFTGTNDNRPEFQRMIEDSNKKTYQAVLVYQLDRFARNRYDSAIYKSKLKKNGVRVLSARENISDDASGILVEGLLESMAEYYSAELSQKIKRGMNINGEKCLSTGGKLALGYKADETKHIIIDEEKARYVQKIFEEYANGTSVSEINRYLNENQIKTSTDNLFNKNSLRTILKNKRYIGIYTYKGKEIKDGVPRIIDDDLFYRVQDMLKKRKKASATGKAIEEYLLTTKLFCGLCREMMVGVSGTSRSGKKHFYYACKNARIKKCSKKYVQKKYIEEIVIQTCRNYLTDEQIEKTAHEVVAKSKLECKNSKIPRLEKLIKENERKEKNLMSAIMECDDNTIRKTLYQQVPTLQKEKEEIEKQLLIEKLKSKIVTLPEVIFFLSQIKNGNIDSIKYRRMLINVFVNRIYLYDDKITFIFNSTDKPVEVTEKLIDDVENNNKCSYIDRKAPPNRASWQRCLNTNKTAWIKTSRRFLLFHNVSLFLILFHYNGSQKVVRIDVLNACFVII